MAATKEEARAARDAKLDELHEKLAGAVETLVTGSDWVRALAFAARFRSRSFNNTLLIWAQHEAAFEAGRVPEPVPSHVAGYRQWQQLGRRSLFDVMAADSDHFGLRIAHVNALHDGQQVNAMLLSLGRGLLVWLR